jgi:tetratricopeptide (TPR) repeat protein
MNRTVAGKAILLLGLVLLVYGPVYRAGFIWDDDDYVTRNATLTEAGGLARIWFQPGATPQYYPATFTSFWIEHRLWGLQPGGYHTVNVLLHAANALLLWRLLVALGVSGAWVVALLFGLHPVQVESVAWITERKNTLSAFFYLSAALAYLRFQPARAAHPRPPWRWYGVALVLFLGALFSKTIACSLPAALLLATWWKRGRLEWAAVAPLLPFFALGVAAAAVTVHMEHHLVRAVGSDWDLSFLQRVLIAGRALWFYAGKLAAPVSLSFMYPRVVPSAADPAGWLAVLGATAVVVLLWMRRDAWGRGPLAAVLYFAGTLLPALGFINIYPMRYSFVADHYQYLAGMGLLTLAGSAAVGWAGRIRAAAVRVVPLAAVAGVLAFLTWQQGGLYRDIETLWRGTLARNPSAWMAHNNLGLLLQQRDDLDDAAPHYEAAYRLKPDAPEVLTNLGNLDAARGRLPEAEAWHRKALAAREDFPPGWYNLGNVLADQGRWADAEAMYQRALLLKPAYPEALCNLAKARSQRGRIDEAIDLYRRALKLEPGNAATLSNLAYLLLRQNGPMEALEASEQALARSDTLAAAHHNRALALQRLGRMEPAGKAFEQALALEPGSAPLLTDFATWCLQSRDFDRAAELCERAAELQPKAAGPLYGLGAARAGQQRTTEALDLFRSVLGLDTNHVPALNSLAWLLATGGEADAPQQAEAIACAQRAAELTQRREPSILSTLAAAFAAQGRFEEAVAAADEAITLVRTSIDPSRLPELEARRALYASGRPYREEAGATTR